MNIASIWEELGAAAEEEQDIDTAKHAFERALDLDSSRGLAALKLGNIHANEGDEMKAIELFERRVPISPSLWKRAVQSVFWLFGPRCVATLTKRRAEAGRARPDSPIPFNNIGLALMRMGRL